MYDIIGDIHGHATELHALLRKLQYRMTGGSYRHPGRKVIFLGDYIDRGPGSMEVIDVVRRMIDAGEAQAVMGNHEFNALGYHTPDPHKPGEFLRPHNEKNDTQHAATLKDLGDKSPAEMLSWIYTLPLWLDLDGLKVVHAFWDEMSMAVLKKQNAVTADNCLVPDALHSASTKGNDIYSAVERVLKGLEVDLPGGITYQDKEGIKRREIRVTWWDAAKKTSWRELAIGPLALRERLPAHSGPIPKLNYHYPETHPPVFVGHYWLNGAPAPLTPNVACVDYSVAKLGGKLAAYRWDGEKQLKAEKFVTAARNE